MAAGAAFAVLLAGGVGHLLFLMYDCPLDLSGDEAHYWDWSRRLDWSYYSKGPLVAYIIALSRAFLSGWSEQVVGNESLAVRVPAIVLSIVTGMGLFVLARQTVRRPVLALAAVLLMCTVPIFAVGSMLMTIDAPLACLYIWTLVLVERGMRSHDLWPWIVAGVLIALGILAKYTMVLVFPTVLLAMMLEPSYRATLWRRGPYVGTLIGLLGLVPILIWNAQHGWVSFRHVAGQAGVSGGTTIDPLGPLTMIGGQLAVATPVWFVAMVWAVVAFWRRPLPSKHEQHAVATVRFLIAATIVPWAVFLAFSPITKIQPNWPVLALLPGTVLLVAWLARLLAQTARRNGAIVTIVAGVIVGGGMVGLMHRSDALMPLYAWLARNEPPWNLTPVAKYDPAARLRGWSQLGQAVGEVLNETRSAARAPFIATDDYQTASLIAFYCPGEPEVHCLQAAILQRQSQYDIWRPNPIRDPDAFVGRPCVYIGSKKPELFGGEEFEHVAMVGADEPRRVVTHKVGGHTIHIWSIYVASRYAGLPPELELGDEY